MKDVVPTTLHIPGHLQVRRLESLEWRSSLNQLVQGPGLLRSIVKALTKALLHGCPCEGYRSLVQSEHVAANGLPEVDVRWARGKVRYDDWFESQDALDDCRNALKQMPGEVIVQLVFATVSQLREQPIDLLALLGRETLNGPHKQRLPLFDEGGELGREW